MPSLQVLPCGSFNSFLGGRGGSKYKNLQENPEKLSRLWQQRNCHGPLPIILAKSCDNCRNAGKHYCIRQNIFKPELPSLSQFKLFMHHSYTWSLSIFLLLTYTSYHHMKYWSKFWYGCLNSAAACISRGY